MAKSKGKSKGSKGGLVEMLLKRAEVIALAIAGGGLAILLLTGVLEGLNAKSSAEHAKPFEDGANRIRTNIKNGGERPDPLPPWTNQLDPKPVPPERFALITPTFEPVGIPSNKRENPQVLGIEKPQVDLVRAPMMGYDVYLDAENKPWIAVLTKRTVGVNDDKILKEMMAELKSRNRGRKPVPPLRPMGPMGPMGQPMGLGSGPIGINPSTFDANSKREETAIEYIPLDTLDKTKKNPALTLIPLRLAVVQATFPLKKQIEEMQRALRLQRPEQVAPFGPVFDGFEVKRQIYGPPGRDGKLPVLQPWEPYNFEEKFVEMIDSRALGYHLDTGYLPYFLRFEEGLAWPLPRLVPELAGSYPPQIRLKSITDAIDQLRDKNKTEVSPSDLIKRLQGKGQPVNRVMPRDIRGGSLFKEQLPGIASVDPGTPAPKGGEAAPQGVDPEYLLLRFVDPDVRPGLTYEYQIRVRMKNPNFNRPNDVASPSYATHEILYGPWMQIPDQIYVPNESFLYGYDTAKYEASVKEMTNDNALRNALKPGPNQAVVEVQSWMEQIRVEGSGNREPVGAWVVAEMPVSRGEYIGRKQYIKLPLWAAEFGKFVLRDASSINLRGLKEKPKGWLVDFSTKSILVDFEGGKINARVGNKSVSDEAATEILVFRPDGRLIVKNSAEDMKDPDREERFKTWEKWTKDVEKLKESTGTDSGFTVPKAP